MPYDNVPFEDGCTLRRQSDARDGLAACGVVKAEEAPGTTNDEVAKTACQELDAKEGQRS